MTEDRAGFSAMPTIWFISQTSKSWIPMLLLPNARSMLSLPNARSRSVTEHPRHHNSKSSTIFFTLFSSTTILHSYFHDYHLSYQRILFFHIYITQRLRKTPPEPLWLCQLETRIGSLLAGAQLPGAHTKPRPA